MTTHRRPTAWLAVLTCACALAACGGPDNGGGHPADRSRSPSARAMTSEPPPAPTPPAPTPPSPPRPSPPHPPPHPPSHPPSHPTDGTADSLLADQIALLAAGDGASPDCPADLSRLPGLGSPAVWIGNIAGKQRVTFPEESGLCLSGFSDAEPVQITVSTGAGRYTTSVQPTPGPPTGSQDEAPDSLFRGGTLAAHEVGGGVMQSEQWWFIPPDGAREELAASGKLTLRATQGSLTADYEQPVQLPDRPERMWVTPVSHTLLVYGFEPGSRIPIGLYKEDVPDEHAVLVRRIGTVTMPRSRAATFTVPAGVLAETRNQGRFCVTVPLPTQYNCPTL
ncbi:hypothetical protein AB0953_08855 [Streptomyces sp. NPDC046866]|uniref:hypothetical protein n=1 Tax=Streptomyces sp. NPDC046866 TaxID=3154921 RepID=UPI003456B0AB